MTRWQTFVLGTMLACWMCGCATPYKRLSGKYGYDDFRITADAFEVSFAANAHTPASHVSRYVFRRAAEVTILNGFTDFAPLSEADRSMYGAISSAGYSTTHTSGSGTMTWGQGSTSGLTIPFRMPAMTMRIRCFKEPPADLEGLVHAQEFLRYNFPDALSKLEAKAWANAR